MIKLINILLKEYASCRTIYLSWDAASWHESAPLVEAVQANNGMATVIDSTPIELAPLPSSAQFLNVIEGVFSGMARSIIHNSDYGSVEEAKRAIDRYFAERNAYFADHPRRAGKKIWRSEASDAEFSEGKNFKDPAYR
jgi:DDE superfamily endonuclease